MLWRATPFYTPICLLCMKSGVNITKIQKTENWRSCWIYDTFWKLKNFIKQKSQQWNLWRITKPTKPITTRLHGTFGFFKKPLVYQKYTILQAKPHEKFNKNQAFATKIVRAYFLYAKLPLKYSNWVFAEYQTVYWNFIIFVLQ